MLYQSAVCNVAHHTQPVHHHQSHSHRTQTTVCPKPVVGKGERERERQRERPGDVTDQGKGAVGTPPQQHIRNQSHPRPSIRSTPLHFTSLRRWLWGDELRVMDICIGTFPSSRQPLFMLKALHIIHHVHISPPHNTWRHFLPPLAGLSQSECAVSSFTFQTQTPLRMLTLGRPGEERGGGKNTEQKPKRGGQMKELRNMDLILSKRPASSV